MPAGMVLRQESGAVGIGRRRSIGRASIQDLSWIPAICRPSARGPLFDHNAEVVEPLDDCFDVAADFGLVLAVGQG